jgi:hypothetical protein
MNQLSSDLSLQCVTDVIIEFSVMNIGSTEETIQNIKTSFNNERPFVPVSDGMSLQTREILPGQTMKSSQRYSLDFCSTYQASEESSILYEVEVDCASGETYISALS